VLVDWFAKCGQCHQMPPKFPAFFVDKSSKFFGFEHSERNLAEYGFRVPTPTAMRVHITLCF
jgi:hypothetical protein